MYYYAEAIRCQGYLGRIVREVAAELTVALGGVLPAAKPA
jgi:hypothetical protein